jgi:hypothetical protein
MATTSLTSPQISASVDGVMLTSFAAINAVINGIIVWIINLGAAYLFVKNSDVGIFSKYVSTVVSCLCCPSCVCLILPLLTQHTFLLSFSSPFPSHRNLVTTWQ